MGNAWRELSVFLIRRFNLFFLLKLVCCRTTDFNSATFATRAFFSPMDFDQHSVSRPLFPLFFS